MDSPNKDHVADVINIADNIQSNENLLEMQLRINSRTFIAVVSYVTR